ncbi:MBL fold metallo-hydrolase [Mammaliicoccus sciuri]|uniref:MBL fold metallo-hydrolase n=1 Tax=Mammaliicoccus sciuri TaxID=1296 RepID=UPI003F54FEE8
MNFTKISKHIYKLSMNIDLGIPALINTWFILKGSDVYIIDTGMENYSELQIKIAKQLGNPKAIILTHGHHDHINGAHSLKENLNIPIYAHANELPYINGEIPYPLNDKTEDTGVSYQVKALEEFNHMLPIDLYLTPGHSPGHIVIHHNEDDILICGDLFISQMFTLHPPIKKFTYDMNKNIKSGSIIDELQPKLITTSHGQDINYNKDIYPIYKFSYEDI